MNGLAKRDISASKKIVLSSEEKEVLNERLVAYQNSTKRISWETIKKKVRAKNSK